MIHAIFIIYNGICLFSRQYSKEYEQHDLLSSFLMAVNQFANAISNKNLRKLILEDDVFSFSMIDNILFVYIHDDKRDNNLEKISNKLSIRFLALFKDELKNFDGEVTRFKKFEKEADNIITRKGKSAIIKMEKKAEKLERREKQEIKGKATLTEMEKFIQGKKAERLEKREKQEIKGKAILIEMEKFLHETQKKIK